MNKFSLSERGQTLVIIAFAIFGLVAMTGLAVDGGMAFSDRRNAQNAADTAALAGALARINAFADGLSDADVRAAAKLAAQDRAESNGYTHNLITSTVEVYLCDEPESSCVLPSDVDRRDYIQVIINSWVDTYFAKMVGVPQVQNRVQAIALADVDNTGSLFDGSGIVSLNPDCPPNGSMIFGGDAEIFILGGGVFSNSDDECAVDCSSASLTLTICAELDPDTGECIPGTITTADGGEFDLSAWCEANLTGETNDEGDQIPYHEGIPELPRPSECTHPDDGGVLGTATYIDWLNPDTGLIEPATRITPGYYGTFPPKKDSLGNQLENTIVMSRGIYCVDTVLKLVEQNVHVWGDDVTIWIREGNGFNINGGVVQLWATRDDGDEDLEDNETTYAGYLIYVEPDWGNPGGTACTFEGNSTNVYVGAIFAPTCDITINGTEDTPTDGIDSQIIGYNIKINGNADLFINYNAENNPVIRDKASTGQVD